MSRGGEKIGQVGMEMVTLTDWYSGGGKLSPSTP